MRISVPAAPVRPADMDPAAVDRAAADRAAADRAAADRAAAPAGRSDGDLSAMRILAAAAYRPGPGVASASRQSPVARRALDRRQDLPAPIHGISSERSTVTGTADGRHASDHVGGGMLPPPRNIVALSDGTRITFHAVAEVLEFEDV